MNDESNSAHYDRSIDKFGTSQQTNSKVKLLRGNESNMPVA